MDHLDQPDHGYSVYVGGVHAYEKPVNWDALPPNSTQSVPGDQTPIFPAITDAQTSQAPS